jgi:WD40 repeat protein
VISLIWPSESKLIIGLLDGKVRLASAASNKCSTLYKAEAGVCALAQQYGFLLFSYKLNFELKYSSPNRKSFLSGHEDGSLFLYSFDTRSHVIV